MKNKQELTARFDARKSFYGKAYTYEEDNRTYLVSYESRVGYIEDGKFYELEYAPHSQTTNRHIKEFKKQFGAE